MRLIDADALLSKYVSNKYKDNILIARTDYAQGARDIIDDIIDAPTVEQTIEKWIPIESRPMDEDERKEWSEKLGYKLEDYEAVIYTSPLPDDGQDVLICLRNGHIMLDTFEEDDCGCYFIDYSEMEGVVAWMPLPKPWEGEH